MDAKTFEMIPAAQTICTEMGHAFWFAKFTSQCQFVGTPIPVGTRCRALSVITRDGRLIAGYAAASTVEALRFRGLEDDTGHSWSPVCLGAEGLAETLAAMAMGSKITLLQGNAYNPELQEKTWRRTGPDSFEGHTSSLTLKQAKAQLTRGNRTRAFFVW